MSLIADIIFAEAGESDLRMPRFSNVHPSVHKSIKPEHGCSENHISLFVLTGSMYCKTEYMEVVGETNAH